ncbi:glutathione S-transferase Mu 3 isoform X2 [Lingula anatina]|uniref:glutathione transferase n=1 Tax=Lingula anatina TaxID=7574 RepID=A0A1S3IQX4_LINAN|nr:glutathione S-transferase Mu 3 isoform X2 [Lingula anatina]|eukprot:XP_013400620.1 glutathione S-transferase Mu 3 isoform X2 [Lingula anatina]
MPIVLGYWSIRGLAQPIRLLLNYVGEEFEDRKYECGPAPDFNREAWTSVKHTLGLPYPNLPYLIDGDRKVVQSNAILRYIGRKHNLCGTTEEERIRADIMENQSMDFRNGFVRLCYGKFDEAVKEAYLSALPGTLKQFEEFLGDNQWFAGANLTFADFPMYELLDQHRLFAPGCLDAYPKLTAFMKRFEALPAIEQYMKSDKFMKSPCNNKRAWWK